LKVPIFTSFFSKIKSQNRSHKTVEIKVFLTIFAEKKDPDPGGPKTCGSSESRSGSTTLPQIYGFIVPDAENVPKNGGKDLLGQKPALLYWLHEELFDDLQLAEVGLLAVDDLRNGLEEIQQF
jgi:hypothetical protein